MTTATALAGELGRASRELAEAIALLPKLSSEFDRNMQLARIQRLRAIRDAAAEDYRRAATGGAA